MLGDVEIVGGLKVEKDIKSLAEVLDKTGSMQQMRDVYNNICMATVHQLIQKWSNSWELLI
jgi:hypothetical protein